MRLYGVRTYARYVKIKLHWLENLEGKDIVKCHGDEGEESVNGFRGIARVTSVPTH